MPKYKIKKKECQLLVNVKLTSGEKIKEIERDAFSNFLNGMETNCVLPMRFLHFIRNNSGEEV